MRLLSFLLLTLAIVISAQSAFALPQMMGNPKSQASLAQPVDVKMRRPLHIEVSLDSPSTPGKGFGGTLEMGWLGNLVGADLRLGYGMMQLGQFFSHPTETEQASGASNMAVPTSEVNRPRLMNSNWSYLMIEPGISVTGRLFPSFKWSQSARFGVARSYFTDSANAMSFDGWVLVTEALLRYHFAPQSGMSVHFGFGYNWGWITRSDAPATDSKNEAMLPIHFVKYILGVRYAW